MSSPSLPADLPTIADVKVFMSKAYVDRKSGKLPTTPFSTRFVWLNSAAELALLWRPYVDSLWSDKEKVDAIFAIRDLYYDLESEFNHGPHHQGTDFKFPKVYHAIAEFTKAIHLQREAAKATDSSTTSNSNSSSSPATNPATDFNVSIPTEPAADRQQCYSSHQGLSYQDPEIRSRGCRRL
ncbi:hypothetical protein BJ165DRAFT_1519872 [Panaeolus papilionaceus]|nr:hypothetical protein BJ165DRAFT_1519872 [Panaeolus papilionaceus]